MNVPKTNPPLHHYARLLGGQVSGDQILCPGPGHSAEDRSLAVKINGRNDDIVVHSFSGDDIIKCKDHVRAKLGLAPFEPKKRDGKSNDKHWTVPKKTVAAEYHYQDED